MNAYKVLQVDRDAEQEVIDAAYKRLASKYHPDKDPSASATKRMQEINAAYEILKDPDRRQDYDDQREDAELREEREAKASSPARPDFPVEEVSNRVFRKVLWAGAFIALLVYFPWGVAVLAGIGGAVWFVKKYPGVLAKLVKVTVAIAVAAGIYWWRQDQKAKDELARLDVGDEFTKAVAQFTTDCMKSASKKAPELAPPYCACGVDVLRSRFDATPINASSVYQFENEFSARLSAASPSYEAWAACWQEVQPKPKPVQPPIAERPRPTGSKKPINQKPAESLSDADMGLIEMMRGPRPNPKYDDPNVIDPAVTEALAPRSPPSTPTDGASASPP